MKDFNAIVKLSFLSFLFIASKSFAYSVRLYDSTPNIYWMIEIDNNVSSQRAFNANTRDPQGLPPVISVHSTVFLAEWSNHIPGVSFARQAETNPGVFQCQTSTTTEFYKIYKSLEGLYACQAVQVRTIDTLTVYVKAASTSLAALVDLKPISANRSKSTISAHTIDNTVPVSDWHRKRTSMCPVSNNNVYITIHDLDSVSCDAIPRWEESDWEAEE